MRDEIELQGGVVTRAQALAAGLTPEAIRAKLRSGRWQRLHRSTYATFSGPVPRASARWAAVLRAGPDATLSHETAAELIGLSDGTSPIIHVTVPATRRVAPIVGVVIHRSGYLAGARHPIRLPPQTRVEETVVDLTQTATNVEAAVAWLTRACARRLTRPARLLHVLDGRTNARWRRELVAALTDVGAGAQSPLELRYLRDVERAHRLPTASRQHVVLRTGGRYYDDVRYADFDVSVELDGRVAHPDEARARDRWRDNVTVTQGRRVLRYGWTDVAARPCEVATQVTTMLWRAGWRGMPRGCGPDCALAAAIRGDLAGSAHPADLVRTAEPAGQASERR